MSIHEADPDLKSNITRGLESLSTLQAELQPEVIKLHQSAWGVVESDACNQLTLRVGKEYVTNASVDFILNDKKYTARAFARLVKEEAFDTDALETGLKFWPKDSDQHALHSELTMYPSGVMLVGSEDNDAGLEYDMKLAKSLLANLKKKIDRTNTEKAYRKHDNRLRIRNRIREIAAYASAGAFALGGIYGLTQVHYEGLLNMNEPEKFDEHGYTLPRGLTGKVAQTIHPEFSQALFDNNKLGRSKIPQLTKAIDPKTKNANSDGDRYSEYDRNFSVSDGLRQIVITTSEKSDRCRSVPVKGVKFNSRVTAWTDYSDINGESRAKELTLRLTTVSNGGANVPSITACWSGKELSESDDPRIVFDIE